MKQIIKKLVMLCVLLSLGIQAQTSKWRIDPQHSKIEFSIDYFKVSQIEGTFNNFEGAFIFDTDSHENPQVQINIEVASVDTNQKKRDEHLRSDDFFSANAHPEIMFKSTASKKITQNTYEISGDFTMGGITKPLVLKATYKGEFTHPRFKNERRIFDIESVVDREAHNIGTDYKPAKFALGNNVVLKAQVHLIKE